MKNKIRKRFYTALLLGTMLLSVFIGVVDIMSSIKFLLLTFIVLVVANRISWKKARDKKAILKTKGRGRA